MNNNNKNKRFKGGSCCCQPVAPAPRCAERLTRVQEYSPVSHANCCIFGSHDEPYYNDIPCPKSRRRKIDRSLGSPVGVTSGPNPIKWGNNVEVLRFAGILKAFATCYFTLRHEWTPESIATIVTEAQVLFSDSDNMENPNPGSNSPVYDENEARISRHFMVNDIEFAVDLGEPFEIRNTENIIKNFRQVLTAFTRRKKDAFLVFWTPYWYLLIWREKGIWLVMDLNGRDKDTLKSNHEGGYPVLLILKSLDNVVHLITSESNLEPEDKFTLREILVVRLVAPGVPSQVREVGIRESQFDVIASDYAYLKSNLHLTLNPKDVLRNRSALPTAVAMAVASQIDHVATWDQKQYDKMMCYGVNMCNSCWEPCTDPKVPMDLDSFPRQIRMGQFVAEVLIVPNEYEGWWKCVPMYKFNDFHMNLERAIQENDYIIFQINNQMYSLWKKGDFIYLMDPYRHHIVGRILEEGEDPKSASVRMFGNVDRLLSVFHQILLESNRSAMFHIHTLKIRNITECPPGTAPPLLPPDEEIEVPTFNENIKFEENYDKCHDELAEISDYEEDLGSELEPIVEVTSSEEMVEEEEGGEGEPVGVEEEDEDDEE